MRYLILFLSLTSYAQASCFSDIFGNVTCIQSYNATIDIRDSSNSPKIIENGVYRGNLNGNQFDPNSISNPYGKYGSPLSPDSLSNPLRKKQ